MIDEELCSSPVDFYKAHKLLTSDLGKVYFKPVGDKYKAKTDVAVQASKLAASSS